MTGKVKLIEVKNNAAGDITIKIPRSYLRHLVATHDYFEDGTRVTHTKTFSDEIVRELEREDQEDGSTALHLMLDGVIADAIDNGCEGVKCHGEDD